MVREIDEYLWCGDDAGYLKEKERWVHVLHCCKEPYHRAFVGYSGRSAPEGKEYLYAYRGNDLALNMVDADESKYFRWKMMMEGIAFIEKCVNAEELVLVHCNQGKSRSCGMVMAYLRYRGDFDGFDYIGAKNIFKVLYPEYEPKAGIEDCLIENWDKLREE